jgi:hypothetical protein
MTWLLLLLLLLLPASSVLQSSDPSKHSSIRFDLTE